MYLTQFDQAPFRPPFEQRYTNVVFGGPILWFDDYSFGPRFQFSHRSIELERAVFCQRPFFFLIFSLLLFQVEFVSDPLDFLPNLPHWEEILLPPQFGPFPPFSLEGCRTMPFTPHLDVV